MEVKNLDIDKCLTTTFYDPSPHRFSEDSKPVSGRKLPVIYTCENCDYFISFMTDDFKKHNKLKHSNLESADKKVIDKTLKSYHLKDSSFLDFYCPKCKQATAIFFNGGSSGYWGEFAFSISHVLVTKPISKSRNAELITKIKKLLCFEKE
jgi:DNA-directed RNA polymerase subunit M/transcription elongation factor TFIIS